MRLKTRESRRNRSSYHLTNPSCLIPQATFPFVRIELVNLPWLLYYSLGLLQTVGCSSSQERRNVRYRQRTGLTCGNGLKFLSALKHWPRWTSPT